MLAAPSEQTEQAEQAARLALRDARDVEIIAAVLSGESHKAVAARHGISAAHARRITQQAREAQPSRSKPPRSKPPRSKPPREPKPQQRRALRIVSNEPADPLTAAERLLGPWRDALPDDRIAVNDGDTIPRPDPPTLFGLFYEGKVNVIAGSPTCGCPKSCRGWSGGAFADGSRDANASCLVSAHDHILGPNTLTVQFESRATQLATAPRPRTDVSP